MVPLKPERKAQLDEYAKRHGQDPADALDDVLAAYFDKEQQDYAVSCSLLKTKWCGEIGFLMHNCIAEFRPSTLIFSF